MVPAAVEGIAGKGESKGHLCLGHVEVGKSFPEETTLERDLER